MPERVQRRPETTDRTHEQESEIVDEEAIAARRAEAAEKISETDGILDDIAKILEENSTDYVESYQQRGGQ